VQAWLNRQNVYTQHKQVRRRFPRNRVVAQALDSDWQADLSDMKSLAKYNGGNKFILICIDVLSKYAWAEPLTNKTAASVAKAFERILMTDYRKPWRLYTDRGREFTGEPFQAYLRSMDIQPLLARNTETKAPIAERFQRTLKSRLWKYFTQHQTLNWTKVLPQLITAINSSYSRTIKRAPRDVNPRNEKIVWETFTAPRNGSCS